jgi:hypothetical protein
MMGEMMREVADNVRAVRVPGTAHFIAEENPSAMLSELLGFLSPNFPRMRIPTSRSEPRVSRLDKKHGLVSSAGVWDVGRIDQQREFGAVCFRRWQA